jgi:hypothetical protein
MSLLISIGMLIYNRPIEMTKALDSIVYNEFFLNKILRTILISQVHL